MSDNERTPGPYKWDTPPWDYDREDAAPWLVQENGDKPILTGNITATQPNAEFVLLACNSFDALLAACESLRAVSGGCGCATYGIPKGTCMICKADAAIAAAKGETP